MSRFLPRGIRKIRCFSGQSMRFSGQIKQNRVPLLQIRASLPKITAHSPDIVRIEPCIMLPEARPSGGDRGLVPVSRRRSRDMTPSVFLKPVIATHHFSISSIPHGVPQSNFSRRKITLLSILVSQREKKVSSERKRCQEPFFGPHLYRYSLSWVQSNPDPR
jgi:hypothetical protein